MIGPLFLVAALSIQGWTTLSDSEPDALAGIAAASPYHINHSGLDYDPYASSYGRSVSGKWLDPPIVFVRHGVDREFHYWIDVIDHLAPAWAKTPKTAPQLAESSVQRIEEARALLTDAAYQDLHHYFARTLLTVRLHKAAAGAYFGSRVFARGESFRTPAVMSVLRESMTELPRVAQEIREYPVKPPVGQWNWAADADAALRYYRHP
jgi:hypothetical protein